MRPCPALLHAALVLAGPLSAWAAGQPEAVFVNQSGRPLTVSPYEPEGTSRPPHTSDLLVRSCAATSRALRRMDGSRPLERLDLAHGDGATFHLDFPVPEPAGESAWDHYFLQVDPEGGQPFVLIFTGAILEAEGEGHEREASGVLDEHRFLLPDSSKTTAMPGASPDAPRPVLERDAAGRFIFRGFSGATETKAQA